MKKRFFGILLMGAMVVASMSMFTSCKDYDDDINKLQSQIDAITAQNLQSQIATLQSALTAAQSAASAAQSAADAAATAAKNAQGTADAATTAAKAAQATADAAAKAQEVADLKTAIEDLQKIVDGKVEDLNTAIAAVEAKIAAINENLLTLDDVKKLLAESGFATDAVVKDMDSQIKALEAYKKALEAAGLTEATVAEQVKKINDAIATLNDIKGKYATSQSVSEVKTLAQQAADAISGVNNSINTLNVFVKRNLSSLVLRPDTYYGGIEGVSVKIYQLPEEKPNQDLACDNVKEAYRYFDRAGTLNISDNGKANYHVNPTYVDLTNYTVDFYNHLADIKQPAATERVTPTRGGDATGITPIYTKSDDLLKNNYFKNGILTVPFKADAATIEANLKAGKGTIASLSMTKKGEKADTTVNSDYAIVVPEYAYGMLIGDLDYEDKDKDAVYHDIIGLDNKTVNSENLHRSFSFLALAATSPTHTVKYDGSFDITSKLVSRVVKLEADWKAIKDTTSLHGNHHATAEWNVTTKNPEKDGDCSIAKTKVDNWDLATLDEKGFYYDIQLVNYTLGTNKTGESVHLELITNEAGHVIAYPRNVTEDGKTITGKTANASCVGRQPIVCIMIKEKASKKIVTFAYMKLLITQDVVTPEAKEAQFDIKDVWVNCAAGAGRVTWSEIEYHILNKLFANEKGEGGMSKKDFDANYIFDYYAHTTEKVVDEKGATYETVTRFGVQYDAKGGKRIDESKSFGSIEEQFNLTSQNVEDATTHVLKWSWTAAQLKDKAEELQKAGKLEDKGKYYANKEAIVVWVRYAHLNYTPITDMPAIGKAADKGNPSIWVKMTIPAGEFHVAKGDMGANKILTYWYDLNSKTNATGTDDAFEVRINVPVPVPEASASLKTIGYSIVDNSTEMDIRYDNLLEMANDPIAKRTNKTFTEFTKNLKDFFIGGNLTANVVKPDAPNADKFNSIKGMKLGCEFILPSKTIGNATFNAGTNNGIDNSWVVKGYTGASYTLILNADRTKIQIKAKNKTVYPIPVDLITLNYDDNTKATDRQITVVNYVNGVDQDDILNYKTHNELGELETFTAYINIKAIDACAPVYWNNMWFNARFLRPLDLEDPKQGLAPDAPNDWHEIDLTDALIVKDWREYYGDRQNRTGGADVKVNIPGVGNVKAFDFAYYQVYLNIDENNFYTDANLGTSARSDVYTLGSMPTITGVDDAKAKKFIKTTEVPNLKLEKSSATVLRYLNNSGVTGGFHVFVPVTMTYVYGYMTVKQTKWVTVGITASVEQAMIEN